MSTLELQLQLQLELELWMLNAGGFMLMLQLWS
jgi:hypothetical protein